MEKIKLTKEQKLKEIIKQQQKIIRVLSNQKIAKGLKSALEDFRMGKYTVLTN